MAVYTGTVGVDHFFGANNLTDTFRFNLANLQSTDSVSGGTGATPDSLELMSSGSYTSAMLGNFSGIEAVVLKAQGISLELNDAVVAANGAAGMLRVTGTTGADSVDAAGLSAGRAVLFQAGAGNDSFAGGAGNDVVVLSTLTVLDSLAGGGGTDSLQLAAVGPFDASAFANVSGFEQIIFAAAGAAVTLGDSVVAANGAAGRLRVAGTSGADTLDASALLAGHSVLLQAGAGNDSFAGGAGDDAVVISGLTSLDSLAGGAGSDSLTMMSAGAIGAAAFANVFSFEQVTLAAAGATIALSDTVIAANGAAGRLTITGTAGADTVDASVLTAGHAVLFQAGAGNDSFAGGAGNDLIADFGGLDSFSGGSGVDRLNLSGSLASYNFARLGDGSLEIDDGAGGIDVVATDIELLSFAGKVVDLRTAPTSPVITTIADDTGESASDFITSDTGLMISGTAQANMTIEVFLDGDSIGTTASNGSGKWTLDCSATTLADDSYELTATATNSVLVTSAASAGTTVVIDTANPSAPGVALASDTGSSSSDGITSDGTLALTGIETDALVEYSIDGGSNWSTSFTATEGSNSVWVRQTDQAGNVSSSTLFGIALDTMVSAPGVALASDTGTSSSDQLTSDGTLSITGTESGSLVEYSTDAGNNWTTSFSAAEGSNTVLVRQTDEAGNVSSATSFTFTLDTAAAAPGVALSSDTGSSSSDLISQDGTLSITGAESGSLIEYSTDSGSNWTTSFSAAEGSNTVLVRQTDEAGNVSSETSFTFTLDTIAPVAPAITGYSTDTGAAGDGITTDRTLTISGTEAALAMVTIFAGATQLGTATADGSGNWSFNSATLDPGSYSFSATTSDTAGNVSAASPALTVQVQRIVDLTGLSAAQGFIIQGDTVGDNAGCSVARAGDVNGDGFDDVIIGAHGGDDGGSSAGEAYVVFGKASGFGTVDLTSLGSNGFIIQGDAVRDYAGFSVSSAGDVNGDGFDDVIVGAHGGDDGGSYAGEAYVVFGKASGFSTIDLTSLGSNGFIIQGDAALDYAGISVSSAGDINGDGFDDVIVGATGGDDGDSYAGEAYVVFGKASGFSTVDLTSLGSNGFIIQGDAAFDYAGRSVASAGDVNGDGYDDLIVGANSGDDGGASAGEAYVVFGKASGFATVDLTSLGSNGFIIQGDVTGDNAGQSVASAGDVNGDGYDDLIVGANGGDDGGSNAGEAYVVFGKASGFGTVDLTSLGSSGFIIQGDTMSDQAGRSVASAGDVNGDGFDDLIVGAPYGDDGGSNAGEAYVVFGKASGFSTVDLTTLTAAQGFIIQGDTAGDNAGFSVASAGDVNNDGFDDIIVGARGGDDGGSNAGEAYVILGGAFGLGTTPVATTGTNAAEALIGGLGNDTLTGGGGADSFRGGAGDDVFGVSDATFKRIAGGRGLDTLRLDGSGLSFDFSLIGQTIVSSIEAIDLTGSGDNSLAISELDILALSNDTSAGLTTLTVMGNAGDSVSTLDVGWTAMGATAIGSDVFNIYQNGQARLLVDNDIAQGGILA